MSRKVRNKRLKFWALGSTKKYPYTGLAWCESCAWDKKRANKDFRKANKMALKKDLEDFNPKLMREVSDVWGWNVDGFIYNEHWKELPLKVQRKIFGK